MIEQDDEKVSTIAMGTEKKEREKRKETEGEGRKEGRRDRGREGGSLYVCEHVYIAEFFF